MYDIEKIQWKIVYTRCTDGPNSWKILKSLNERYRENSREICLLQMYRNSGYFENFEFVE